jgi:hypothetical protein
MNGLELWEKVEKTDPEHTKAFTKGGGFKGTAIKPIYLIKKATELWGPAGDKWGWLVLDEKIHDGAPLTIGTTLAGFEKLHSVRIGLWYPGSAGHGVESYGHTILCGQRSSGAFFTDDEAPKKSLTDAIGKALHYLGFSADVYFGQFDGSKYESEKEEKKAPPKEELGAQLEKSIEMAKAGKEIEEKIAQLTELDTASAGMLLVAIRLMPEGAVRERRKELLRSKVKEFGWITTQTGEGDNSVITFSIPASKNK